MHPSTGRPVPATVPVSLRCPQALISGLVEQAWQPLLQGEMADKAREAISGIAADLEAISAVSDGPSSPEPGLAQGYAGMALFFGYLALAGEFRGRDLCAAFMDRSLHAVTAAPVNASLYSGITGVAWVGTHLAGLGLLRSTEDPYGDVDRALLDHLSVPGWHSSYDLVSGLVGIGVYALERMPRPAARDLLSRVVDLLSEGAERTGGEARWFTGPEHLPSESLERYPAGFYNLGVAHGWPGAVTLIAGAVAAGIGGPDAELLLAEAITALMRHRMTEGDQCFPATLDPELNAAPSRTGWCYGDPGVSAALTAASSALGDRDLLMAALEVAETSARLPHHLSGIRDAGLCHGSAGVGHLLNRVHQTTGSKAVGTAAVRWFEEALKHRRLGWGVGGFKVYTPSLEKAWSDDPGFLVGAAGIGLALLAATTDVEPLWDSVLLASLPDR